MQRMKRDPGPGNTALRRPADRTRSRWLVALVLSWLAAVVCGVLAGLAVWDTDSRAAQERARHRHPITATAVSSAEPGTDSRSGGRAEAVAQVVWRYPATATHTGKISVPLQTRAGESVQVWVDDAGTVVAAPRSGGERGVSAAFAGVSVACVIALSAGAAVHLRLRLVEVRNLAQWERDWEVVEPLWSGRTRSEPGPDDV
ncbi:Rv1733c family protein [Streptomyces sp. NPDC054797]